MARMQAGECDGRAGVCHKWLCMLSGRGVQANPVSECPRYRVRWGKPSALVILGILQGFTRFPGP